jgi:Family of unknown function (DUF6790)
MFYIISYLLGWIIGITFYFTGRENDFINCVLLSHLVFTVGFFGLFNFIGHSFLSEKVANRIGWITNGFQKELGYVSFGIGICGIMCFYIRDTFWLATIIPFSTFLLGAAFLHSKEIIKTKNYKPGNTWIIIPDVLMPITLIVLWLLK